ncbi:putative diguanylate cyclase YdaM [Thalassocella blandensis]|nr:putative diguanylate cyclase YdaM [Thalassocella blandensis]
MELSLNKYANSYEREPDHAQIIARQQHKRTDRLGISFVYQLGTCSLVLAATLLGELHWLVPSLFLVFIFANTACLLLVFRSNLNLYFKDPSLTTFQILLSYVPPIIIMYFFDSSQARAAFIIMALVPISFGVFLLTTKQFLFIGVTLLSFYALVMILLAFTRPQVINPNGDMLQTYALVLSIIEISLIGGYITGLRTKLTARNKELESALNTIQDMANRDALTGVYNRRYLFNKLEQYAEEQQILSVCLMDIDGFKSINEIHGHLNGDLTLQRIANSVTSLLDESESFGRYGGEEFLLILPNTDIDIAKVKADTLRHFISKIAFPEIGQDFRVTVSVGIAEFKPDEDIKETINRADLALFEAKSLGVNHSVIKEAFPIGDFKSP